MVYETLRDGRTEVMQDEAYPEKTEWTSFVADNS